MKKLLAVLLLSLCCFTSRAGDPKKEFEGLQGTWTVESMLEQGKKPAEDEIKFLLVTVAKDVLTVTERGKKVSEFQIKIDPAQKPKSLDLTHTEGKAKGKVELAIYDLAADNLKICINEVGKDRPKEFASTEKSTFSLIQLKRKK